MQPRWAWRFALQQTLSVLVCTLLNLVDAATYGRLTFPIGDQRFRGADVYGMGMFLLSCGASQIVVSLLSSIKHGVAASAMVESLPFIHAMCWTAVGKLGEEDMRRVYATVLVACSMATLLTAGAFAAMAYCGMGHFVHQYPRCVLVGSMGGIGAFLLQTGLQIALLGRQSAWDLLALDDPLVLCAVALLLALLALVVEKRLRVASMAPMASVGIFILFYAVVLVAGIPLEQMRRRGWLARMHQPQEPIWSDRSAHSPWDIFSNFRPALVSWATLPSLMPTILATAFFGLLHVPINIPSYARTTGLPFDMTQELKAHAASNLASTMVGMLPNYFVYTNSLLFLRAGARGRTTGVALGVSTLLAMSLGIPLLSFIPTTVIMFLIVYLGLDLLNEALLKSRRLCSREEHGIIVVIVVAMLVRGFVSGVAMGLLLAGTLALRHASQARTSTSNLLDYRMPLIKRRRLRKPEEELLLDTLFREDVRYVRLEGHRFFGNSIKTMNAILSVPPNAAALIIHFPDAAVYGIDMNIVEGLAALGERSEAAGGCMATFLVGVGKRAIPGMTSVPHLEDAIEALSSAILNEEPTLNREADDLEQARLLDRRQRRDIAPDVQSKLKSAAYASGAFRLAEYKEIDRFAVLREGAAVHVHDGVRYDEGAWLPPGTYRPSSANASISYIKSDNASPLVAKLRLIYSNRFTQ